MGGKRRKAAGRKCRDCDVFNDLDARYCGQCGNILTGYPQDRGKRRPDSRGKEPSYWMIVAIIALIFSVGLGAKTVLYRSPEIHKREKMHERSLSVDASTERQVQRVASNFRCACGGCGELPLIECNCDMPRGAVEEKTFIRERLKEGFTIDQVIERVERKYGLRIEG